MGEDTRVLPQHFWRIAGRHTDETFEISDRYARGDLKRISVVERNIADPTSALNRWTVFVVCGSKTAKDILVNVQRPIRSNQVLGQQHNLMFHRPDSLAHQMSSRS